jgi:hypothetical protein
MTNVVQGHVGALYGPRGQDGHVGLPISGVRGGDRTLPQHQSASHEHEAEERPATVW